MAHRQTFAAAGLTVLAAAAPSLGAAQPIDLLAPAVTVGPSDMVSSDTRSPTSPAAPVPSAPADGSASAFLETARGSLAAGRTGEAREALERAEIRLLQRSAGLPQASPPDGERAVRDVGMARRALASHDRQGTLRAIDDALAAARAAPLSPPPPPAALPPPAATQPMVTYALLPGHWHLEGARYVWVPPETVPRPVEDRPFIQGQRGAVDNGCGCRQVGGVAP